MLISLVAVVAAYPSEATPALLRHVGWDMKLRNPQHFGVYYDEVPTEPYQSY